MKETLVRVTAGENSRHEPATRSETKTPRKCQAEAYSLLKGHPHVLIEGPTGSGKSISAKMLLVHKKNKNAKAKSLVIVPQRAIVEAWGPTHIKGVGHWKPRLLTSERGSGVKKELIEWASGPNGDVVCTHMGLIKAWPEIKDMLAKTQTTLWIDEAHHLEYLDTDEQEAFVNQTANVLQEALAKGIEVGISSATLFRGDKSMVLNPSLRRLFKAYRMEFSEYITGLEYIKDIRYVVETYSDSPIERLQGLKDTDSQGTIVYIPSPQSRESKQWAKGDKHKQVQEILQIFGPCKNHEGLLKAPSGHRITNLVCDSNLQEKEEAISQGRTDIIISLRRFLEGANWLEAHTAFIIGRRQSPIQIIQILGRLLRDHLGKSHVKIVQLFPTPKTTSRTEISKRVEDYLHTLCGTLLIRELLQPKHSILQRYGSETAFKTLKAATKAFQKTVARETELETATRIQGSIESAARRCQPNLSQKEISKIAETAELLVATELENHSGYQETTESLRPQSGLQSGNIKLRLTERVARIGRARKNLRITSINLAGGLPELFRETVRTHTEEILNQVHTLAKENNIGSLEEWHDLARKTIRPSASKKEDRCLYHPETTPGWDSWETLMDPHLIHRTWDKNFEDIILRRKILTQDPLILSATSRTYNAKVQWIARQRISIRQNKTKTAPLQRWMHAQNIGAIPPIIPHGREEEAKLWIEELGAPSLETNPQKLYQFLRSKRIHAPFLAKAKPMSEETIPVETYWLEAQTLPAKTGSLLDFAQRQEGPGKEGYLRFMKAVSAEKLRKKQAA